jgi:hypothetical protein
LKNETDTLKETIKELQKKQADDLVSLKQAMNSTYENLRPANLFKNIIQDLSSSSELKGNILSSMVGIGSGLVSKKVLVGGSKNLIVNTLGNLVQFTTANFVAKHAPDVKHWAENLVLQYLKNRKNNHSQTQEQSD